MAKPDNLGVTAYIPPCPAMLLDEQVRHARGFASHLHANDHHTSRLLNQLADSIEALAKLTAEPATVASHDQAIAEFTKWLAKYHPDVHNEVTLKAAEVFGSPAEAKGT